MADQSGKTRDGDDVGLEAAAKRLERAAALLEARIKTLSDRAEGSSGGLFDQDRSQLAADLDASRARERELQAAGEEASQALGMAIRGIRAALERTEAG
jgi:hypothetical protein